MNILQVVPYFFLEWSNTPVDLIYEISLNLVNRGHDVTIYTTNIFNKKSKSRYVNLDGISVYEFTSMGKYPFFISLEMSRKIMHEINNYDVIHVHEYRTFQNNLIYFYSKKHNIPYLIQAHGALSKDIGNRGFKWIYDNIFGHKILKNASGLIAITEREFNQYISLGAPENIIEIVPNGIDFSAYNDLPKWGNFRKKYSIPVNDRVIIYLGRLDETKGIELLIESFYKVSFLMDNLKLVIAGKDYGSKSGLLKLVDKFKLHDKIFFTGFLGMEEKISALTDSDVFVTPSYNGFPHSFLESCACGTPIITTKKGDKLEWLDEVGFVVDYNLKSLSNAIYHMSHDDDLRKKFSMNCRKLIKEQFDWSIISSKLEYIYSISKGGY